MADVLPMTRYQTETAERLARVIEANGEWVLWSRKQYAARNRYVAGPEYERKWRRDANGDYGFYVRLVSHDRSVWTALWRLLNLADSWASDGPSAVARDVATIRQHFAVELSVPWG